MGEKRSKGLVLLFIGNGKGKTSAAMGTVLRLAASGKRVLVVQFAKAPGTSGEQQALRKFAPRVVVRALGRRWLDVSARPRRRDDLDDVARQWKTALALIARGRWDAVVLDELNFVVSAGFLSATTVAGFLDSRPAGLTVILTGRGKVRALVARADTVTEMKKIKHPFDAGRPAVRGIDF